ncbi:MAG: trehalose-phosphatase [Thermovirgaceae bacterium]|jgi:alpha,alpha-trehalase|nr:trehalose-phosphatase [Synergistales bacterium]MDI9393410.1 trehalose-phosphatase [Synergistota bacterium]MDY0179522.1 trehalose-phosphatase [Synergistaceae bacterium]HRW87610.1 trehalose-phosphatase [Thermovirgaceae bacterium]MDD3134214.1 trehalose-phosphatase [Synergistales bacterium]
MSINRFKGSRKRLKDIPHALSCLEEIESAVQGKTLFTALDFDGTLAPLNNDPEAVEISAEMKKRVKNLALRCHVAIMTGRDLDDIRERVGLEELFYSGSHGFEIAGPRESGLFFEAGKEFLPVLNKAEELLPGIIGDIPGVLIQRKRFSISIHYRMVERERIRELIEKAGRAVKSIGGLVARNDKKALEILPGMTWNKGSALLWILEAAGMTDQDSFAISMGDDVTDEDMHKAVKGRGAGIIVTGTEPHLSSFADYRLGSIAEAGRFIEILERIAGNISQN